VSLEELRDDLGAVDRRLIELVAERQAIVEEIGREKLASGRPARDFRREKQVLDGARAAAEELGVPPDVIESIMRLLIRSSLTSQELARVAASGGGDGERALVIGGAGRMGRWFAEFLDSQGYEVEIADPAGPVEGFGHVADWRGRTPTHELIVVAAPLAASAEALETLAELRPPGVVFDIGSLKSPLRGGLQRLVEAGCSVASIHPMFGPDTRLLSGKHVIFVDLGDARATARVQALFASTMAEPIEMELEEHDRLIAYVLGLSHALNLAFLTALAESGEAAPRLARLSSTTFDAQLEVAARVADENPHLYFEIQALNDHNAEALEALSHAVRRVTDLARAGDEPGFVRLMEAARGYLDRRG
jgi:chorismate mutase / prephenate dehydrogenase